MKKVINFLGRLICVLVLAAPIALVGCSKVKEYTTPTVQNEQVYACIDQVLNPLMTSINEVVLYHSNVIEEYMIHETFCNMAPETVRNIASVLIKKHGSCTTKEIVYEYNTNKQIYDNLPGQPSQEPIEPQPDKPMPPTIQPNTPNLPPPSISTRIEDDTVDGVPLKVTIKEEKTYEQK